MGLTPAQVSKQLGPNEYMKLCAKVAQLTDKGFDITDVTRMKGQIMVTIVTADGKKQKVEL